MRAIDGKVVAVQLLLTLRMMRSQPLPDRHQPATVSAIRERIVRGRQAEIAFSLFRRLRNCGFHDGYQGMARIQVDLALPPGLWFGAQRGVLVQRLQNQKLGEQSGVRFSELSGRTDDARGIAGWLTGPELSLGCQSAS